MKNLFIVIALAGVLLGQANPATPTLPTSIPPSTRPAVTGNTCDGGHPALCVHAGETLAQFQTLINTTANCGDEIVVDDGVTINVTGGTLTVSKLCTTPNYLLVTSASAKSGALPITPLPLTILANYNGAGPPQARPDTTKMFTLSTTSTDVFPMNTADGSFNPAKYIYFSGMEVVQASTNHVYDLILMSSDTGGGGQETKLNQLNDHIIFDRVYMHGQANVANGVQNCIFVQGTNISIVNSYCDNVGSGNESHGFLVQAGGPFLFSNNVIIAPNNIFTMGAGTYNPYIVCDVASSPLPTTTTATVANCKYGDGTAAPAPYDIGPPVGTIAMFFLNGGFRNAGSMTISANTAGALTFCQPFGASGCLPLPQTPDNTGSGITVASFPACNSGSIFTTQQASNSTVTARGAVVAGGGSNHVGSYCDGTSWKVNDQQNFTISFGFVPHDMTITNNLLYKYPCWNPSDPSHAGTCPNSNYMVKDFFETKGSLRVNINGNVMMNTWNGGQAYPFNITNDYWFFSTSADMTITNNVIKNISGTFATIVSQPSEAGGPNCPANVARVLIKNNLFFPVNTATGISSSDTMQIAGFNGGTCLGNTGVVDGNTGVESLQVIHNMIMGPATRSWALINSVDSAFASTFMQYTNYVVKDNIIEWANFSGNRFLPGSSGINENNNPKPYALNVLVTAGSTNWVWSNNGLINSGVSSGGPSDATLQGWYPSIFSSTIYDGNVAGNYSPVPFTNYASTLTNYHNFALSSGVWLTGASDGTAIGVDFTALDAALGGGGGSGGGGSVTSGKGSRSGKAVAH